MKVSLIVALSKNKAIGLNNRMLWRLRDDFKNYKKITMGHCLIMGRKTFESIGSPLPGRTSIVISRNKDYEVPEGVHLAESLEDALEVARLTGDDECFINGGGEIYSLALPLVTTAYITEVDTEIEKADAFFPEIDFSSWKEVDSFTHEKDKSNDHNWTFFKYEK
jgi:dihydrofolate reductase